MKKIITLILLPLTSYLLPLHAQTLTYAVDSTCGCDILYIDGIQTTRDGNLYGFKRYDGTVIAPNIYDYVGQFQNGYCQVWQFDTSTSNAPSSGPALLAGLIDSTGRTVVPCIYASVNFPSERRIAVRQGDLWGYTDLQGRLVIDPAFPGVAPFSQGRAAVATLVDSTLVFASYIDTLGNLLFPPDRFQQTLPFVDGYAPAMRYDRWGIIDRDGNEIVPFAFEFVSSPDHSVIFAGDEEAMALFILPEVSPQHQIAPATPFIYIPLTPVTQGRIAVFREGKQGFLDLNGDEVIPCIYDEVGLFAYGRTMARVGDRYGIIDTLGNIVLPIEYHSHTDRGTKYAYFDGLALVEQNNLYGFVDTLGHFVVPLSLSAAFQFSEGLAAVQHNGFWGYIDTTGNLALPLVFDRASPFLYQRADVSFQGRHLKIAPDGHCVANCNGIISFR